MASTHIRIRRQSPKLAASEIAPIVQKLTRCATAPKTTASRKAQAGDERPAGVPMSGHPKIMARGPVDPIGRPRGLIRHSPVPARSTVNKASIEQHRRARTMEEDDMAHEGPATIRRPSR